MTVRELIALLSQENGDDLVVLARDSEGNGFSPLSEEVSADMYIANSTWSGEVKLRKLTRELAKSGWTEEDVGTPEEGAQPCVTLWPMN